jgi:N-acetylglucosamine-6-phosphate deacetylase
MILLSAARIVTPDTVLQPGTVVVEGNRIAEVRPDRLPEARDLGDATLVPGFVDVHVHGVDGVDALMTAGGVARMARAFPKYGVTAFCPTAVACPPNELRQLLADVASARAAREPQSARVLPAHLESNFINPEYCGAQPRWYLRQPAAVEAPVQGAFGTEGAPQGAFTWRRPSAAGEFTSADVLNEIASASSDVGIVTLAPELPGALELIQDLARAGHRVSLGHSGATYDQGLAAVRAGACHATHLFNRMPPFSHRAPGLVGAIFDSGDVTAELIADGHHVHPAMARAAIRLLGFDRAVAVSDGTAVSSLGVGAVAQLGSEAITAGADVARLHDGTWAGSVATMASVFRTVTRLNGCGLVEAARLCSTNPARRMNAPFGRLAPDAPADFVVLGPDLEVLETFVDGVRVWPTREP